MKTLISNPIWSLMSGLVIWMCLLKNQVNGKDVSGYAHAQSKRRFKSVRLFLF